MVFVRHEHFFELTEKSNETWRLGITKLSQWIAMSNLLLYSKL
jgi:hypothetical protein